ncbi:MAG: F0F1 ATP synthase subunit A [Planctomycetes bacterium]|nr:F0F1 ATP synthase subunit A [Planctomycetota bacterium]
MRSDVGDLTRISPDELVYWTWGAFRLNATIVFTWTLMAVMVIGSWLATRRLRTDAAVPRWQALLELAVEAIRDQIREVTRQEPRPYIPFIGTLFLFIALANTLSIVPGYLPPTASLSTTAALAICVFVAVPAYGMLSEGPRAYFRNYVRPSWVMLPFNVMGELSRTLALAVRLFGNVMSGMKVAAIIVAIVPFIFPIFLQLLGLLTGLVQAYIFAILAAVYIASGVQAKKKT